MIGNNSCGATAQRTGKVVDNIARLEVLLYDGTRFWCGETDDDEYVAIERRGDRQARVYRQLRALRDEYADDIRAGFPDIPRRVSGYNLDSLLPEKNFDVAGLLVGSESTLVTVLQAELELVPVVKERSLVVLGLPDDHGRRRRRAGDPAARADRARRPRSPADPRPADQGHERRTRSASCPTATATSWCSSAARPSTRRTSARTRMLDALGKSEQDPDVAFLDEPKHEDELWQVREAGLGATAHVPNEPDTWEGWEDSAVHPDRLGDYLRDLEKLYEEFGYADDSAPSLYGHFGQGCVHTRIPFGLTDADGVAKYRRFLESAADLVASYGGSLSGEHGDGQTRGELLPRMFGDRDHAGVRRTEGDLRPGRPDEPGQGRVARRRLDAHLRLGGDLGAAHRRTAALLLPRGRRLVRQGGHALRRCRQVPPALARRRRGDVPVVPGDARGGALHARPFAAAVRDAARAPRFADQGRLALDGGARRARPVPRVQGLQVRLPRRRRHGDVQGGVPRAPLRRAACARARTTRWAGCRCSPAGRTPRTCRRIVNALSHAPRAADPGHTRGRPREPRNPIVRRRNAATVVDAARRLQAGAARHRHPLAGHVHEQLPSAHRPGRGRGARGRGLDGAHPDRTDLLRADLDLDRPARHRQEGAAPHGRRARRPRPRRRAGRSGWNRAARRCSAPTPPT